MVDRENYIRKNPSQAQIAKINARINFRFYSKMKKIPNMAKKTTPK
jgi:hypothetical protein